MTDSANSLQRRIGNLDLGEANRPSNKHDNDDGNRENIKGRNWDVVMETVDTCLKNNDVDDLAETFLEKLKMAHRLYMKELSTSDDESSVSKHFQELQGLAIKLSGTFEDVSDENNKHKSDLLKIVNEGIEYAFTNAPKQLSFLDGVVIHFLLKLPSNDILEISGHVDFLARKADTNKDPGWRAFFTYRTTLGNIYTKMYGIQGSNDEKDTAVEEDSDPEWMLSGEDEYGAMFRWCGECVPNEVCKSCGSKNGCPPDYKGPKPVDAEHWD